MKKARMNISHFRFILFNLKIFGEIVTTLKNTGTIKTFHCKILEHGRMSSIRRAIRNLQWGEGLCSGVWELHQKPLGVWRQSPQH